MYTVYVDGSCSQNHTWDGGWAAIVVDVEGNETEQYGFEPKTTNSRMELVAPIKALESLPVGSDVTIVCDSAYVVNGFLQGWLNKWQKNGWCKADGKPVLNKDLWVRLLDAAALHNVTWEKVKGHAGHSYNERVDVLAVKARCQEI